MVHDESKKESVQKEEQKARELKMEILVIENELFYQNHTFGMINDFGSDSNSLNIKMNGLMKEESKMSDEFEEREGYEMESQSESMRRGDSGESYRFGSPLRRNIFAGIDLEESSKKRLFESEKKEMRKDNLHE
jgi:hypothetical protein